jgi:polysaccharide export outer membrane protein
MLKLCGIVFFLAVAAASGARSAEPPSKELVDYIRHGKKVGTSEDGIRRTALNAGWDPKIIDEAFAAIERIEPPAARDGSANANLPDGYRIGPGDVLQVSVYREPEASVPAATVRSDGKISVPLIKEVEVVGLTATEAERMLSEKLSRYIRSPEVTLIISQINSRKVYLVGAVKTVGSVDLKGPMTVLQAIAQAGGLTEYAKRKQIYVLRTENGKQLRLPFNYDAVIKGEKMEPNIVLSPNDTIVVPQ